MKIRIERPFNGDGAAAVGAADADVAGAPEIPLHQAWCERYDAIGDADRARIAARLARLPYQPLISLVMPLVGASVDVLRRAVASVTGQLYDKWELCIADATDGHGYLDPFSPRRALDEVERDERINLVHRSGDAALAAGFALELATGDFVVFMRDVDELRETALYMLVEELNRHPDADIVYSDEDCIDASGVRHRPHFKPDWNPDLFYGFDYVGDLAAYRASLVQQVGGLRPAFGEAQIYDLRLRLIERSAETRIRHIPFILYHSRRSRSPSAAQESPEDGAVRQALLEHLSRSGERNVGIASVPGTGHRRIVWPVPDPQPLVSLIIPSSGSAVPLRRCVEGLLRDTAYRNLELVILGNPDASQGAGSLFDELSTDPRVRVVARPAAFDFAEMCNSGAAQSRGDILCLISECLEVIEPGWLREMVGYALRPEIGAVGAMLYDRNNAIRHAGMVLGLGAADGIAGAIDRGLPRGSPGYFWRAMLAQELSCVSAACMVLRREIYVEFGGFDERLPPEIADVDLCLKIRSGGYRVVWTPFAALRHLESEDRGKADGLDAVARMYGKWGPAIFDRDPYFNPNLRRDAETSSPGRPRIGKPWADARANAAVPGAGRRARKWYFCINQEALEKYAEEIDLAVHSCIQNTSLEPHVVFDGEPGWFADKMAALDVAVHFTRTPLAPAIAALPNGPYAGQIFRHVIARGAFLRYEIGKIEFDDEFVLYTDCDVMFRRDVAIGSQPPDLAACPDSDRNDWREFNSGVIVFNVPRLRQVYDSLMELARAQLGLAPSYDQPILNDFFKERWTRLPLEYNWRPYWGFNEDAVIVHLHGPKLAVSRQLLGRGGDNIVHDIWKRLFETNPGGYRSFLAEADRILAQAEGQPRLRG